jgi:hypothetical protein
MQIGDAVCEAMQESALLKTFYFNTLSKSMMTDAKRCYTHKDIP